jgi:CHAT domain-containing protein/regulator of sirC expression with transglutaminase-like and TPR domain
LRLLSDADYSEELDIIANELIDEYVVDKLSSAERDKFEKHFLKSQARREKLGFALALKRRKAEIVSHQPRPRRFFTFYLPIAASILLLIGLGFGVWRVFFYRPNINEGLVALHEAFKEQRPIESRISDFNYAPVLQLRGTGKIDYVQRDRAASLLLGAVAERPTAEAHRALGQYYLATRQFDKAIDQFKAALSLDPNNAKAHSDLGAALLEEGKLHNSEAERQDGMQALAESLQHLNKALELDGSLIEALFNRALLYQYMKLPSQAEDDWRTYLNKDPNSHWAEEARQNLKMLEEQREKTSRSNEGILRDFQSAYEAGDEATVWNIVSSYHNRTGNIVFEQALDSYLEAAANGRNDEAAAGLQLLSYVGELEGRKAGDNFFSDLARFYGAASPDRRAALASARATMKAAHDGWGRSTVAVSLSQFSDAREMFEQSGDTYEATFAGYWISFCLYQQHNTEHGLAVLQPLLELSEANGYKWLLVRTLYLSSILQYDLTNYSQAVGLAERSLDLAKRTDDAVGKLNALSSLIEYYRHLNNFGRSLAYIQRSLSLLKITTLDPIQGCRHYGFVATSLAASGWYDAAADYQKEALRYAFETERPATISYNLAFLGQIDAKLRKFDEALNAVGRAFQMAEAHPDDPAERDRMAYSSLQMGHIYRQAGNFDKAIESYNRSINLYEELNYHTQLYQAYKGRLLCYVAQGNDQLAGQEMSKAVGLIESYRDKIFEEDNRDAFFDAEQSIYDIAIGFEYSRMNSPEEAFEYSESSRARSLLDLMHSDARVLTKGVEPDLIFNGVTHSLSLAEIRQRMPDQTQVMQFALLEDRLLIWVVSKNSVSSVAVPVTRKELQEKVRDYLQLLSSPAGSEADASSRARELHDILIKPAEHFLEEGKQVYIVPDKILNLLPFGTLISRASGRYLVEDYTLTLSPSSTMLVVCSEMAAAHKPVRAERILSVGNPRFDHDAYPSLPDLPSASKEAAEVAGFYDSPPLLEDDASVKRVMSEMAGADIVHFALHSVLDERFPLRSKFLLSKSPVVAGDSQKAEDALFAYDIYSLKLPQTRLAVLSACETGGGHYFGGEGIINMARPFIAAGVPLVVASLWSVDSNSTAELMVNFHRLRTRGGFTTADALRKAQLDMLRDERLHHPYYWAPFVVIGGYANF